LLLNSPMDRCLIEKVHLSYLAVAISQAVNTHLGRLSAKFLLS
jgi:hypothetical protein